MRAIALAAVLLLLAVSAGCGSSRGAVDVSGPGRFRPGGNIFVNSISCAAPGECAACGYYRRGFGDYQAFVVDETDGRWGTPIKVPHSATPLGHSFPAPGVGSISCPAVGDCAAGGIYYNRSGSRQAFVVNETNGTWGKAITVHGTGLHTDRSVELNSISCGAAGECAACGWYADGSDNVQAFVDSETRGRWGNAIEVPGMATLNTGGDAEVDSISCATAGECAAGGFYDHGHSVDGSFQAFVVNETNGTWGKAIEVPGTATLNNGDDADVDSISCAAPGELRRRRRLQQHLGQRPGLRGRREERQLGHRDRGAGRGDGPRQPLRQVDRYFVCRARRMRRGRLLRPRPFLRLPEANQPSSSARRTAVGATRSTYRARRRSRRR